MSSTLSQASTSGTRVSLKCWSASAHPSGDLGSLSAGRVVRSAAASDGGGGGGTMLVV